MPHPHMLPAHRPHPHDGAPIGARSATRRVQAGTESASASASAARHCGAAGRIVARALALLALMLATIAVTLLLPAAPSLAAPPAYPPVTPLPPGQSLQFPRDFGAHPAYKTEWWYATGWLKTPDGKDLGYQVTFFRVAPPHDSANPSRFAPRQLIIGHVALSDPATGKLRHDQRSAREGFGLAYAKTGDTDVKLDDWRMARKPDGVYHVSLAASGFTLDLTLRPRQGVMPQGENGYSRKGPDPLSASYYYSEPQLETSGTITRTGGKTGSGNGAKPVPMPVTGVTWLDHEWSSAYLDPDAAGWDWVGINLADGGALMAFHMRGKTGGKLWAHATWRDASGKITHYAQDQVSFTPLRRWRSPRTNAEYPVAIQLATGDAVWHIAPLQDDQELDSRRSTGAVYWEGAVTVRRDGVLAGKGYLELTGYVRPMKM